MRLPTYAIGIGSSTTATKAVVWDQDGRSVAEGRCAFPLTKPRPGWHEQDAEDWWRSTIARLRDVAAAVDTRQIGAIGLTHQRETFVGTDDHAAEASQGTTHKKRPPIDH
jgi:xylulokinase